MFRWLNIPKVPQATWLEVSKLYIEFYKTVTYSEIDHEEFPVVYRKVPSIPIGGRGFGVDFTPLTFLSCFSIYTHLGNHRNPNPKLPLALITQKQQNRDSGHFHPDPLMIFHRFSRDQNAKRKRRQAHNRR